MLFMFHRDTCDVWLPSLRLFNASRTARAHTELANIAKRRIGNLLGNRVNSPCNPTMYQVAQKC
jgi:hypothetical protein